MQGAMKVFKGHGGPMLQAQPHNRKRSSQEPIAINYFLGINAGQSGQSVRVSTRPERPSRRAWFAPPGPRRASAWRCQMN